MFDIIGYWFGVSLFSYLLLLGPFVIFTGILCLAVEQGLPDKKSKKAFSKWMDKTPDGGNDSYIYGFGGLIGMNGNLFMSGLGLSFIVCVVVLILFLCGFDIVQLISDVSMWCTPVLKYVFIVVGSYMAVVKLTKYIHKALTFKDKVEEHMKHEKS